MNNQIKQLNYEFCSKKRKRFSSVSILPEGYNLALFLLMTVNLTGRWGEFHFALK